MSILDMFYYGGKYCFAGQEFVFTFIELSLSQVWNDENYGKKCDTRHANWFGEDESFSESVLVGLCCPIFDSPIVELAELLLKQ